jgi:outer membrane protein assembly factor BamB
MERAGRAFIAGDRGTVYAFDTTSGAVVRTVTVPTSGGTAALPLAVDDRAELVFAALSEPVQRAFIVGPGRIGVLDPYYNTMTVLAYSR